KMSGTFAQQMGKLLSPTLTAALFSSGRSALRAGLEALQLPPSSGIIVQTYVCDAVLWAIGASGHRPVLSDIGQGWTCGVEQMMTVMDGSCKALVLAPPFGFFQSAQPFRRLGLPIVHDLCQASPRLLRAQRPHDIGDLAVLSFHPTKYMCAAGGGAI